jgi:hypothetical protein
MILQPSGMFVRVTVLVEGCAESVVPAVFIHGLLTLFYTKVPNQRTLGRVL